MTKIIKLILLVLLYSIPLFGEGVISDSMGGTGIAHFSGAESATKNPALITKSKGTSFIFGGGVSNEITPYAAAIKTFDNGWAMGISSETKLKNNSH